VVVGERVGAVFAGEFGRGWVGFRVPRVPRERVFEGGWGIFDFRFLDFRLGRDMNHEGAKDGDGVLTEDTKDAETEIGKWGWGRSKSPGKAGVFSQARFFEGLNEE